MYFDVDSTSIHAAANKHLFDVPDIAIHKRVSVHVDPENLHLIPD